MSASYEILGIGAPIGDYILRVSDAFLRQLPGTKAGMQEIDLETLHRLIALSGQEPVIVAGGSGANTMKGLARLGHRVALAGKIGRDPIAQYAMDSFKAYGVKTLVTSTATPTSQVLCLVTPSGDRTFRSYMGASREFNSRDLTPDLFQGVRLVHIEGYAILNDNLLEAAMTLAQKAGAIISYDLGSHELVSSHRERILHVLEAFVDLLFCNRDEITALLGDDMEAGCDFVRERCEVAVILLGSDGCLVGSREARMHYPADQVNTVDTTGAGDLFASGFLHGYLNGHSLEECARFGAILGSSVIQVVGAEIPVERWEQIQRERLIT
jgi:sugar/nucleoside kinase (ribokinase family)